MILQMRTSQKLMELIETLWNVNSISDETKKLVVRINRNIVECKFQKAFDFDSPLMN